VTHATPPGALAAGPTVVLRPVGPDDLTQICRFPFTVSIREPLEDREALQQALAETGFWTDEAGAAAIVDVADGRLLGTAQFYRAAPCIHGLELGYIIHRREDRGRGFATEAVRLLTDHLFQVRPDTHRLQLIIEVWNVASWKLAERCGYVREGLLRSAGFAADDPADCFLYARTRRDWRQAQNRPVSLGG